jgi:spore maturation protein CgeB
VRVAMFYHSALSDWNHGNAHFLRGIATELIAQGHDVRIFEQRDAWSIRNLLSQQGEAAIKEFQAAYPNLDVIRYDLDHLDLHEELASTDLVIVHEWNSPELVARVGLHRECNGHYHLFFHDTHHRSVTDSARMSAYDLRHYDGVLAYGASIRDVYLRNRWAEDVYVWHEAADTRMFRPLSPSESPALSNVSANGNGSQADHNGASKGLRSEPSYDGDVVWIGNWGDDERAAEIKELFIEPIRELRLRARVYGVRYPTYAIRELADAGIEYAGWLPNFRVPQVFSRFRVTVHIPRRPYVESLRGIPTIRPFEALACKIPLISVYWDDCEGLFSAGSDYLVARDGKEMKEHLQALLANSNLAAQIAEHGYQTILRRHTCAHRVDELLQIYRQALRTSQGVLG